MATGWQPADRNEPQQTDQNSGEVADLRAICDGKQQAATGLRY
jgi:hypothetical protein